jgi:hypothetical protein
VSPKVRWPLRLEIAAMNGAQRATKRKIERASLGRAARRFFRLKNAAARKRNASGKSGDLT